MLTAGKHVEEAIKDEKHAKETRKERQMLLGNSASGASKKNKPAKETTTGDRVQKIRCTRKPKKTNAASYASTDTPNPKPARKSQKKRL